MIEEFEVSYSHSISFYDFYIKIPEDEELISGTIKEYCDGYIQVELDDEEILKKELGDKKIEELKKEIKESFIKTNP